MQYADNLNRRTNISLLFFIAVAVISMAGFFNSYLKFFPDFERFPFIIHIHFFAFSIWFALLIIQPILIRKKKFALHRKLGKVSYFIAPLLVATIAILVKKQIQRELLNSETGAAVTAFVGIIDIVSFSTYYVIAMINSSNTRWHIAFIVAATIVVLNPGLSRLLNQIQYGLGIPAAILLPYFIAIPLVIIEKVKFKKPILKSPYYLYLCCWTVTIALFITIPNTQAWVRFVISMFGEKI